MGIVSGRDGKIFIGNREVSRMNDMKIDGDFTKEHGEIMNNLAVILARSGSERIPNKNMRDFHGKPIIQYSLDVACGSGLFNKVIVSTDSDTIGAYAAKHGALYFKRGDAFAQADAPMVDALLEVIGDEAGKGREYDTVCMIYACSPFVRIGTIKKAFDLLPDYDVVFPIFKDGNHAERSMIIRNGQLMSRNPEFDNSNSNLWPNTYQSAGQFYLAKVPELILSKTLMPHKIVGVIIPETEAIDIDTPEDWERAELIYHAMNHKHEIEWTRKHRKLINLCEAMEKTDGQATLIFRGGNLVSIKATAQNEVEI